MLKVVASVLVFLLSAEMKMSYHVAGQKTSGHATSWPDSTTDHRNRSCMEGIRQELLDRSRQLSSPYFDASGHIGSGVMSGNLVWLGHYQQCVSLTDSRYCLADLTITSPPPQLNESSLFIRWGLCAVSNCTNDDIKSHIQEIVNGTLWLPWLHVNSSDVHCAETLPYTTGYYATVGILVGLAFLVLAGTIADIAHMYEVSRRPVRLMHRSDSEGSHIINADSRSNDGEERLIETEREDRRDERLPWERPPKRSQIQDKLTYEPGCLVQFFLCFSVMNNIQKLLQTKSSEKAVTCLHGLRVISMLWIVLGHTFLAAFSHILDNPLYAVSYSKRFSFQPIGNAYFAVDTFLFLSGFLVAYLSFHEMDQRMGKLPLCKFYIHRYLRLTPNMAIVMLFWMFVLPHILEGPIWYQLQDQSACKNYWWTNMLYILNFYPTNPNDQCIGWTWYLAVDMQLYWLSPFVLYTLYKSKKFGMILVSVLIALSLIITAILITMFDIDVNLTSMVIQGQEEKAIQYESILFMKPYCRMIPYLMGIWMGYVLYRQKEKQSRIPLFPALGIWFLAIGSAMATVYGLYQTFHGHALDDISNTVYGTFSKLVWGTVLMWVVYACQRHHGGPVETILSWQAWAPLSRLTYSVYLLHPVVMFMYFGSLQTPVHITDSVMAFYYLACVLAAYLLAVVMMLLVELPVSNLEKLMIGGRS